MIAIFCGLLRSGGRPTVFGDGTQTRDYIYVGDVVAAALAAAGAGGDRRGQRRHRRRDRPCWSWSRRSAKLGGAEDFEPEFAPPRTGEVQRISIDASRAERELGWRPPRRTSTEGLRLTLDAI